MNEAINEMRDGDTDNQRRTPTSQEEEHDDDNESKA